MSFIKLMCPDKINFVYIESQAIVRIAINVAGDGCIVEAGGLRQIVAETQDEVLKILGELKDQ